MFVYWECSHLKPVFYLQFDSSSCLEVETQQADFLLYDDFTYLKYTPGGKRIHGLRHLDNFIFYFHGLKQKAEIHYKQTPKWAKTIPTYYAQQR